MCKLVTGILIGSIFMIASCSTEPAAVDCSQSTLALTVKQITESSDCAQADGQLEVSATGGKSPYQYTINGQSVQSSGTFKILTAGTYSLQVLDADQCSREVINVVINASALSVETSVSSNTQCTGSNGKVTLNVSEGVAPFKYNIGTDPFTTANVFNEVPQGLNQFNIQDNNNCMITLSVNVPRGMKGTSWINNIRPIMTESCALTGCHDGSIQVDLRVYATAKSYAPKIKEFTQDRSMPFDGSLEQSKIDLIACWVDDGALNN